MNKFVCVLALLGASATASADVTRGLELGFLDISADVATEDYSVKTIGGSLGFELGDYVSVEGTLGFGIDDEGSEFRVKFTRSVGVNVNVHTQLDNKLIPYAKLGYTNVRLDVDNGGLAGLPQNANGTAFSSAGSFVAHVGVAYPITNEINVNFEYMQAPNFDFDGIETEINGFKLGISKAF